MQTYQDEDRSFAETPFVEPRYESYEEPQRETVATNETLAPTPWHFDTPFETFESFEQSGAQIGAPEVATLAEIAAELKDHLFRESLEALATEALETHAEQLAGEYGDREQRDVTSERLLNDHFAPLATEMEAALDRLFERFESYETAALTEAEIERVVNEIAPAASPFAPASEQFLGGLLRKAGKLVSGAVRAVSSGVKGAISLAGQGLAAIGKLALGPLLKGLKRLGIFLLKHVVKFALGNLPPAVQPMARQLSDRLFRALGETQDHELTDHEQTEAEVVPAGVDVARLEAEFDLAAAQLMLAPEEAEAEYLAEAYGEGEGSDRSLNELDDARANMARSLRELETGESAQPVMEQFLPAMLWPVAKTAITVMGRPKLVSFIARLISGLIKPMIGSQAAGLLGPAIADAGLRIFGLEAEAGAADPRALTAEALAATVEETVNRLGEFAPSTFENETLLESAVREAFEDAAATYFPNTHIKAELRETHDQRGVWMRMPHDTHRKRYSRYSDSVPVTITPRVADSVRTFGNASLSDHLRDRMDVPTAQPLQTKLRLYQVLPGATTSSIARAEGINPRDLHPLTPQAAGALLGPNAAGLGLRTTPPGSQISTPHRLHLRQRLYYVEPPSGRTHQSRPHARLARSEVFINLRKGEIKLSLFLSEPLAQKVSVELAKSGSAANAYRLVQPLIRRAEELVKSALLVRHLPPAIRIIGEAPNLGQGVPPWLSMIGTQLSRKVAEWAAHQISQYLRNNAEQFRRLSASEHDGVTLRIAMSRVPGFDVVGSIAKGQVPRRVQGTAWLRGEPAFQVVALAGYALP
ncbi:hypothetical protein OKW33_003359 [Paraburkholderia atlantica]|uniref:hypothetical protein n=1 Tax=Paraburkholderia atlantica TaxID=2654982 RepID=UPI00128D3894|nr:hypothetical protein [Paraburkholderia atlantica]MPW10114.1 hypothetical protein [Paraburkholderia atlantica]